MDGSTRADTAFDRAEKVRDDYRTDMAWEASRKASQRKVYDNYENAKEELDRIESTCRAFLDALNDYRRTTYKADLVAEIDAYACDTAGGALDLLHNLHHEHTKAADEAGLDSDAVPLDLVDLANLHIDLKARADARQSPTDKRMVRV